MRLVLSVICLWVDIKNLGRYSVFFAKFFLKRLFAVFQTERKEPQSEISLLSFASNLVIVVSSYAKS